MIWNTGVWPSTVAQWVTISRMSAEELELLPGSAGIHPPNILEGDDAQGTGEALAAVTTTGWLEELLLFVTKPFKLDGGFGSKPIIQGGSTILLLLCVSEWEVLGE